MHTHAHDKSEQDRDELELGGTRNPDVAYRGVELDQQRAKVLHSMIKVVAVQDQHAVVFHVLSTAKTRARARMANGLVSVLLSLANQ